MATFKDQAGREWRVTIDTWSLRQVREGAGFELGKLLDDNLRRLHELAADPELFCRVLLVLCGDQAKEAGVSEEAFFRGMAGDALVEGWDAFMKAFADFCPSHRRELLGRMAAKAQQLAEAVMDHQTKKLEAIDTEAVLRELTKGPPEETTSNGPATGSPESPASIRPA